MKLNLPPISKDKVLSLTELSKLLSPLVGTDYVLTISQGLTVHESES